MKKIAIFLLFVSTLVFAGNITVRFQVNMKNQFRKGIFSTSDSLVVRGDFQTDAGYSGGNWSGNYFKLSDSNNDSIYTIDVNLPTNKVGTLYSFKYVKNDSGWEPDPNRTFTLQNVVTQTLPVVYFGNDSVYVTMVTNTYKFIADMSSFLGTGLGHFDPVTDSLLLMGLDWDGLGTLVSGTRKMLAQTNPNLYITTLTVRGSLGDSTKWKVKAYPDSRFQNTGWELGNDRWLKYVADGSVVTVGPFVPNIVPIQEPNQGSAVTFSVNMQNAVNRYNGLQIPANLIDFVGIKGGTALLGNWGGNWTVSDTVNGVMVRLFDDGTSGDLIPGDRVWSRLINFPPGTTGGNVEFKFAAHYPGADTINSGVNPLDNELAFGSHHVFTITPNTNQRILHDFGDISLPLKLINPKGGETFAAGSQVKVLWTTSTASKIGLLFSSNNGAAWDTVISNYDANKTAYIWTAPSVLINTCKMKIVNYTNPTISFTSNTFSIGTPDQVTVTFRVNMKKQMRAGLFGPLDSVVVRGDFQTAAGDVGNWQGNLFKLLDPDYDSVYTVNAVFPVSAVGTSYNFKFVKNDAGWEPDPNRNFTLQSGPFQVLPAYWFANDSAALPPMVTNTIKFTANMSDIYGTGVGYFDPNQDSILVAGLDWDGLGTVVSGNRKLLEVLAPAKRFTTTMVVKGILGDSTKWKFRAYPEGKFQNSGWELGEDRWFKFVADGSTIQLDEIKPRIAPVQPPLTSPVTMTFAVNMKNAVNRYNGQPIPQNALKMVGVKGGTELFGNWGGTWTIVDTSGPNPTIIKFNDNGVDGDLLAGDNIWSKRVTFPIGTAGGPIEYKFSAFHPGCDTLNGGFNYLDNELGFGHNHYFNLINGTTESVLNNFGEEARLLKVARPNGGEIYSTSSSARIFWTTSDAQYVKVLLSTNNGSNWDTIASHISARLTSFLTQLPNVNSTACKIRIVNWDNPADYDESDAPFTIQTTSTQITWQTSMLISDNSGTSGVLTMGTSPGATNGIDPLLGELTLPPPPPTGNFDVRMELPITPLDYSLRDFRNDSVTTALWLIKMQPGNGGYPMHLSWNKNTLPAGSFLMKDMVTGTIINLNMKTDSQLTVTNTGITSLGIYFTKSVCKQLALASGWNMISVPLQAADMTTTALFAGANSPAYGFNNGYQTASTLTTGKGYWIRYPQAAQVSICGNSAGPNVSLSTGWNLIGVFGNDVVTSGITTVPAGIINSPFYAYNNSYTIATTLTSGKGYWVRAAQAGTMTLPVTTPKEGSLSSFTVPKEWSELNVADAAGKSAKLYFGNTENGKYELPPVPPQEAFDIRFTDNAMVHAANSLSEIRISGAAYPLTFSSAGKTFVLVDAGTNGKLLRATVKPGTPVMVQNASITAVRVESTDIPLQFALEQNYPNPFNPATTISFSLPERGIVSLKVYNQLGELITVLQQGEMESGYHSVTWNASSYPSGVYMYELKSGQYSSVKKLVLMK